MNQAVLRHRVFVNEYGYNIWAALMGGQERVYRLSVGLAVSPIIDLVFHLSFVGVINALRALIIFYPRTDLSLTQIRRLFFTATMHQCTIIH